MRLLGVAVAGGPFLVGASERGAVGIIMPRIGEEWSSVRLSASSPQRIIDAADLGGGWGMENGPRLLSSQSSALEWASIGQRR